MRYLLFCLLLALLTSCAHGDELADVLSQPVDSTMQRQVTAARLAAGQLSTGRVKFNGPVVLQFGGTGNTATATDAHKAKAPVAAAPGAVATATRTQGGPPWYVYVVLVLVGALGGAWLRGRFSFLNFLK
ncbi:MAG: hypothetical protein ACRYFX_04625 [Janthinobacterium lividum]